MQITLQQLDPDITLLGLNGSLDTDSLKELRSRVNQLLEEGRRRIIIDCISLKFVSSAGIGGMVMLHRRAKEMDAIIRFAGAHGAVLDVLELMNLGSILNLSPDTDHARQALAQTHPGSSN